MARTARRQNMDVPVIQSALHKATFTDHAGEQAIRVRWSDENTPLPLDFKQNPVFCFQIYSTITLRWEEDEAPAAKRARVGAGGESVECSNLENLIQYLAEDIETDEDKPVFEIYAPQADAFACVEHQKREIAHRKAKSTQADTFLIPKVVRHRYDRRRSGFLIVINSEDYKGVDEHDGDHKDENGPLFIWFDRRFPSATGTEPIVRLLNDPKVLGMENNLILPEKAEITVKRQQETQPMRSEVSQLYLQSTRAGMDFAQKVEEGNAGVTLQADALQLLTSGAQALSLDDFHTERHDDGVTITTTTLLAEPELRYIVYLPFLHQPGLGDLLESAAKAFTAAVCARLQQDQTISFEFRKSQESSLSSILHTHQAYMASKPADYIGTTHNITSLQTPPDLIWQPEEQPIPTRLYPCTQEEQVQVNLSIERYKTFIIVIDKPDFADGSGVLFLLTDGGRDKILPGMSALFAGPTTPFVETQVWRSAGMDEVARRLALVIPDVPATIGSDEEGWAEAEEGEEEMEPDLEEEEQGSDDDAEDEADSVLEGE